MKSSIISSWRKKLDEKIRLRDWGKQKIADEELALTVAKSRQATTIKAQEHIQEIAKDTQEHSHKQIGVIVSKCLSAVFDRPYELKIEMEKKRGKTEATFVYYRDGHRVLPGVTSGGVREVASLALRLASLCLSLPPMRKLLVLDEPFSGLSESNRERIAVLIETLAKEMEVQFIICTHDKSLMIGKVVEL